jgi:hypothetical protein
MDIKLKTSPSVWTVVICVAVGLTAGFWLGRKTIAFKTEEITERVFMSDSVPTLEPVIIPDSSAHSRLPVRVDTVYMDRITYTREVVDTAAIIADYEVKRRYLQPLFDNSFGKLDVGFDVQYNRVDSVRYTFIPLQTVRTVTKEKAFSPFVSVSYSTFGITGFGAGAYYNRWGAGYQYQRQFLTGLSGHGVTVFYRW